MRKIIMVAAMLVSMGTVGQAQDVANVATGNENKATGFVSYRDAVKACGAEWRASDAKKAVAKGEGRKAWSEFRAKCVTDKGYVKGAKAPKA